MYETFDHTADLGLRIRAASVNQLFLEAGQALFSIIVEDAASVQPRDKVDITIVGDDLEFLLFDWLRTLLYHFDAEHMLFSVFTVEVEQGKGLTATVWGESLDRDRHVLGHEVKAITYHGLLVEPAAEGGWLAEVIVDI